MAKRKLIGGVAALGILGAGAFFGWGALAEAQSQGRWMLGLACPLGSSLTGKAPPDGTEVACEEKVADGSVRRHGGYRAWHPNGQRATEGWYVHGKKHRPWHVWTAAGKPASRGKYSHDRQDGFWMTCSEAGAPVSLQVYDLGKAGELLSAAELATRAAAAGPDDVGHFRWGHEKIQIWCSGSGQP
jgi:hypothetical protein